MLRRSALALAALVALVFLVVPSLDRLVLLADPPANDASLLPTDVAFVEHRALGLAHVLPGLAMVALAPLQLAPAVRRRWPALHRWAGRAFVAIGVLVAGSAAIMNVTFPVVGGLLKVSVIHVMCVAQVVTLAMGLHAIRRRDVAAHRRWMLRAMGVALAAGTAGLFVVPFYAAGELDGTVIGVGRWLGLVVTVAAVELWLRSPPR